MTNFFASLTSILSAAYVTVILAVQIMAKLNVDPTKTNLRQGIMKVFFWCRPVFPVLALATIVTGYMDKPGLFWLAVTIISYGAAVWLAFTTKVVKEKVEVS